MDLKLVLYTHTDCIDVWPMFFGQYRELLPEIGTPIVFCNLDDGLFNSFGSDILVVTYDDREPYTDRVRKCLAQLPDGLPILYLHEDMPLYKRPKIDRLQRYSQLITHAQGPRIIKLIKGGETRDLPSPWAEDLKLIPSDSEWLFTIQPSLGLVAAFKAIFSDKFSLNIWDFELQVQAYVRSLGIPLAYASEGGELRGLGHWDSSIFPYIATAIVKGKWNFFDYWSEMATLLLKYNIDPRKRGFHLG